MPQGSEMKVSLRLSPKDILAYQWYNTCATGDYRRALIKFSLFTFTLNAVVAFTADTDGTSRPVFVGVMLLVVTPPLCFVMCWLIRHFYRSNILKAAERLGDDLTNQRSYSIDENGFAESDPSGHASQSWPAIREIISHDSYTFFQVNRGAAFILPMETPGAAEFVATARNLWGRHH